MTTKKCAGARSVRFEPCVRCRSRVKLLEDQIEILKRRNEILEITARTDLLTGLMNRRGFEERLFEEAARARRGVGKPMSIAVFDLDRFKQINDTHGHATGDAILRKVGSILAAHTRRSDVVARIGGEEFAFILVSTTPEQALNFVERIRKAIEKKLVVVSTLERVRATASFGVVTVSGDEEPHHALDRADKALYRAKQAGRNRVEYG